MIDGGTTIHHTFKTNSTANNLSVNIYTDESRSVVAEQVQQMYGELA